MKLNAESDATGLRLRTEPPMAVRVGPIVPRVVVHRGPERLEWIPTVFDIEDRRLAARNETWGLSLALTWEEEGDAVRLAATVINLGVSTLRLAELSMFYANGAETVQIGPDRQNWSVFRNGYQSWSGTRAFRSWEVDRDPPFDFLRMSANDLRHRSGGVAGRIHSDLFTAITAVGHATTLCLGFVGASRSFGAVRVDSSSDRVRLDAFCDFDGIDLLPGQTVRSEPLRVSAGSDAVHELEGYATAFGNDAKARVPDRSPSGWCSWYYYFTKISEEKILENLDRLVKLKGTFPCDYIQIDDGYQHAIGDWLEANDKFPHGMGWLAEKIRDAGYDAGIWIAPFIARKDSSLMRDHPHWFLRKESGPFQYALYNPMWGAWGLEYALDTTHPEVLEWLESLARTIARDWGYKILKLDFLFAGALPGLRYDRTATRAEALRRGLEAIRRGAGEDAFLLGCGCPLGPAVGIVDAMRIGADVAPFWSLWPNRVVMRDLHGVATRHAIRNILTRSFLHRRLWLNDPDCLMVRSTNTRLTEDEVRTLAAVIALTDGMYIVSDRMDELAPERIGLLQQAQSWMGGAATAIDLFESDIPELLVTRRGAETLIGVFNFSDESRPKVLDLSRYGIENSGAEELWSGHLISSRNGWVDLGVFPPHASRILRVKSGGNPPPVR